MSCILPQFTLSIRVLRVAGSGLTAASDPVCHRDWHRRLTSNCQHHQLIQFQLVASTKTFSTGALYGFDCHARTHTFSVLCNVSLVGMLRATTDKLQRVLIASAHVVIGTKKYDRGSYTLNFIGWMFLKVSLTGLASWCTTVFMTTLNNTWSTSVNQSDDFSLQLGEDPSGWTMMAAEHIWPAYIALDAPQRGPKM